jgi:hypothetical protein
MMILRWTRTVLFAVGFVSVMLAWQSHERAEAARLARFDSLVQKVCAGDETCELQLGVVSLGRVNVSGSVDVTGR